VEGRPSVAVEGLQNGSVGLLQQVFGDITVPVNDRLQINDQFFGAMTFVIMTISMMTISTVILCITTQSVIKLLLSIVTINITTLSISNENATLSLKTFRM
jgi:hypothetical protein